MNPKNIKKLIALILVTFSALGFEQVGFCSGDPKQDWDEWMTGQVRDADTPIVQNRQVSKAGRFQIVGPLFGMSDRRDLYNTYLFTLASRYHFSEHHGWELVRLNYSLPIATSLNTEIQEKTKFHPDVQLSRFQLSSAYIFSPIYGKYAWGSNHLIYFDIFTSIGGGIRLASDQKQAFGELGIGMNHYLFFNKLALVPEFRLRGYMEQRTQSTFVMESTFQLGTSWLF